MRIVMMGTGTFAEPTFQALLGSSHRVVGLVTQPDRPGGHERGSTRQTGHGMKQIAEERGIPVLQPENVNAPEGVRGVKDLQPDLLVVAAYGQILSRDVLAVAPLGGINVHASLLPRYRGAAPIAWAIYRGEARTGVTIIRMSISLDAGDMLAQEAIDIGPEETAGELEHRLAPLGAQLALQVIDRLAGGRVIDGTKQEPAQTTRAPKLKKEQGLIDWTRSASEVCNQIRAMQPWPTAYTYLHRTDHAPMRLLINKARVTEVPPETVPGSMMAGDPEHLCVGAGQAGGVEILELQPAGKRRMTALEFLRGHRVHKGDFLGPEKAIS